MYPCDFFALKMSLIAVRSRDGPLVFYTVYHCKFRNVMIWMIMALYAFVRCRCSIVTRWCSDTGPLRVYCACAAQAVPMCPACLFPIPRSETNKLDKLWARASPAPHEPTDATLTRTRTWFKHLFLHSDSQHRNLQFLIIVNVVNSGTRNLMER